MFDFICILYILLYTFHNIIVFTCLFLAVGYFNLKYSIFIFNMGDFSCKSAKTAKCELQLSSLA